MTLDDLIPPHVTAAVRSLGLHKVAGAMVGVPELTVKEAVAVLGAKAYLRRKEARAIVDGILSYAALAGEKTAEGMLSPQILALLRKAALPAAGGAALAYGASKMNQDPMSPPHSGIPAAVLGALTGGTLGAGQALHNLPGDLGQGLSQALR